MKTYPIDNTTPETRAASIRAADEAIAAERTNGTVFVGINTGDTSVTCYEHASELPPPPPPTPPGLPALPWRAFFEVTGALGIDDEVKAYVAAAPLNVQREYHRTLSFERDHPLLVAAIAALKLDPAEVDEKWRARAATSS